MGIEYRVRGETAKLQEAGDLARAHEGDVLERIRKKIKAGDRRDFAKACDEILSRYAERIAQGCAQSTESGATNLFELVGATKLIRANQLSRVVSTQLGAAWEEIAAISKFAVSPELDLGLKITGIDLIFAEEGKLRHTQIKTQKNTLTGSQKDRSISELRVHPHPLFAAAFNVASWTFPPFKSCGVERVAGEAFWSKLEIDYDQVVAAARRCVLSLESRLFG
jgi:hypothetical protein